MCTHLKDVSNQINSDYLEWRQSENLYQTKLIELINKPKFPIIQKFNKDMPFFSRHWNRQKLVRYLLEVNEKYIIEAMGIIHYNQNSINDLTIEISNMFNCPVGCQFCASGSLESQPFKLTSLDYLTQIYIVLQDMALNPSDFEKFFISFEGIGEPSIVYSEILNSMSIIKDLYPNAKFNIATFGVDLNCFDCWKSREYDIHSIQIPFLSYEDNILNKLVKNLPKGYSTLSVLREAVNCLSFCAIKLNYIVIEGINDTEIYVKNFCDIFKRFKERIVVKVSILNPTLISLKNNLKSPKYEKIVCLCNYLKSQGFKSYIFGSIKDPMIGCGQLAQINSMQEN